MNIQKEKTRVKAGFFPFFPKLSYNNKLILFLIEENFIFYIFVC